MGACSEDDCFALKDGYGSVSDTEAAAAMAMTDQRNAGLNIQIIPTQKPDRESLIGQSQGRTRLAL